MLALSSAWFKPAERSLDDIFAQLTAHGFRAFELNHVVHPVDIEAFLAAGRRHGFTVSSLHNVCSDRAAPLEPDNKYGDNIASLDEDARRQSVAHLRSTAETALALGASAIVVHCGSEPAAESDAGYRAMMRGFRHGTIDRAAVLEEMQTRFHARKQAAEPHLQQLHRSLAEVCAEFPALRFGLECRYHFYSFPDIDEMDAVLSRLNLPNVGYWHDCGHAQVQENLGVGRHAEWLERYADRLVGVHLHGLSGPVHDHYAPAPGNVPFELVARYLRPDTVRVMEVAGFNSFESLVAGRDYLLRVLAGLPAAHTGVGA